MKQSITVADILNSVEFELMQHTLLQDDVADSIQRLRAYQVNARSELFTQGKSLTIDSAVELQLETSEMLLTLVQVMNQRVEALQQDVRRSAFLKQHLRPAVEDGAGFVADPSILERFDSPETADVAQSSSLQSVDEGVEAPDPAFPSDDYADNEHAAIQMDVRQSNVPLLGGLMNQTRKALHELVLFYVNQAVMQQAEVNRTHSELLRELLAMNRAQAKEISELRSRLSQLTAHQPGNSPAAASENATEG